MRPRLSMRPLQVLAGLVLAVLLVGVSGLAVPAQNNDDQAQVAAAPILQIDPGGHMATIRSLAFSPDGRELYSISDDKLVRVWDPETGAPLRTLRGQIGGGSRACSTPGYWLQTGSGWRLPAAMGSSVFHRALNRGPRCGAESCVMIGRPD